MILKVLLYWNSVSFALLNFSVFMNVSVHVIDMIDNILHCPQVLLSFECPSFAAVPLHVRLRSFVFCSLHLFLSILPTFVLDLFFGDWVKDSFPCASSQMASMPNTLDLLMYHGAVLV